MTVLVTGAAGSVGQALLARLPKDCDDCPYDTSCPPCHGRPPVIATDIVWGIPGYLDVTNRAHTDLVIRQSRPTVIYHLAGAKHAFDGELDPAKVAEVNINGTINVLDAAAHVGAKVVFASTCKACDPETAYGATKLIAERLVLNADGTVARYFNIPESCGNVFRLWETIPADEPIPITDCWRYFIPMERAVDLTLACAELPTGRYAVDPGMPRHMSEMAEEHYPGRETVVVPRRRGDRHTEPLKAVCEEIWPVSGTGLYQVRSPYDPAPQSMFEVAA